jgi:iron complex outermembrane receptor protein
MTNIKLPLFFLLFLLIRYGNAQEVKTDSLKVQLESVTVNATKLSSRFVSSSLPVSVLKPRLADNTGIGFQSLISGTPGLFALNANNYAQDLRISIRGFGARSAFGIRGIKIVVDGVPETTPDGQGQLDNLDLYSIDKVEIVRGAASSLYGNASGGVIYITSNQNVDSNFVELNAGVGSYGIQKYDASFGIVKDNFQSIIHASHAKANGYREQSGFENNTFNANWNYAKNDRTKWSGNINYTNAPIGDDPGGITLEDVNADRRQARARNVQFKAGESIQQLKGSVSFQKEFSNQSAFRFYGFANNRLFKGKLPFENGGIVNLNRFYYGQGGHYTIKKNRKNRVEAYLIGYDIAFQNDDRKRYDNLNGMQGGQSLNQTEQFNNQAVHAMAKWTFSKWFAEQSIRVDFNQLENTDQFLGDGDDSGEINLTDVNFSSGLGIFLTQNITLVGRYGTAFETPALSELSANPTGNGGFNDALSPQSSTTLEFGVKGNWRKHLFEVTWFTIDVKDEILPYELDLFPGRTFYNNSGLTNRQGVEIAHARNWFKHWSTKLAFTYSDFKFEEFGLNGKDFSGMNLPGIPKTMFSWQLDYDHETINVNLKGQHYSSMFANNDNSVEVESYALVDLSFHRTFKRPKFQLTPYIHFENLLNADYFDNIRINAFGNRFYEPGPERQFRVGVKLGFR